MDDHRPPDPFLIVTITAADEQQARTIARGLLEQRLIAGANLTPVQSLYWWEDAIHDESEVLIIAKTRAELFDRLEAAVKALHSYTTPEIIGVPVAAGSPQYLQWIEHEVQHITNT